MALRDYTESIEQLQKGIGKLYRSEPWMLNIPGKSIALKIDPLYYLVVMPAFVEHVARAGGMLPSKARDVLVKTGNLITAPPARDPELKISVTWGDKSFEIRAAFLDADFVDRSIKLHGGLSASPGVSELKIISDSKPLIEQHFQGKTPPQEFAYE